VKFNLLNGLYGRFLYSIAGVILGMILGILILVRWLGLDPMLSAMFLVLFQVVLARLLSDWRARLVADAAILGMILSHALATSSWKTILAAVLAAPVCAAIVALLEKGGRGTPGNPARET
jgi:hypothetical protein